MTGQPIYILASYFIQEIFTYTIEITSLTNKILTDVMTQSRPNVKLYRK